VLRYRRADFAHHKTTVFCPSSYLWLDVSLRDDGSAQASHFTVRRSLGMGGSLISGTPDPTAGAAEWDELSESAQPSGSALL